MKEQIIAVQRMQDYIKEHFDEILHWPTSYCIVFSPWYSYRLFGRYTDLGLRIIFEDSTFKSAMKLKNQEYHC